MSYEDSRLAPYSIHAIYAQNILKCVPVHTAQVSCACDQTINSSLLYDRYSLPSCLSLSLSLSLFLFIFLVFPSLFHSLSLSLALSDCPAHAFYQPHTFSIERARTPRSLLLTADRRIHHHHPLHVPNHRCAVTAQFLVLLLMVLSSQPWMHVRHQRQALRAPLARACSARQVQGI